MPGKLREESIPSLQLPPNTSFQSIGGTVLAAGAVPQRWRSALLGVAEPPIRWAAGSRCDEGLLLR